MKNIKNRKLIGLFKRVQNVPYFLFRHRDSKKLFKLKKGGCAEKAIWLGNKLKEMDIPVKYYRIEFKWEELPIPKEIIKLKKKGPIKLRKKGPAHHLVLKAKVNNKWLWLDPTWDPGLEKGGFPVTKNWNGKTNTKLAVRPVKIEEFEPNDPSDIELTEFTRALNKYLDNMRKKMF